MSAETSSKDPVRIVYHTENRTFARLFNERSLEEVKDVVRRKLGLGKQTAVSLKQMGNDALLDLEDDDDFQAFCVFVNSSVSVDIAVTVGKSQGLSVPPLPLSGGNETTITSVLSSKEPATTSQPTLLPQSVEPDPAVAGGSHGRKRKVSFEDTSPTAVSNQTPKKRSAKPALPPQIMPVVKPPPKNQKKDATQKPGVLEGGREVATTTSKNVETSPPAKKKQKRLKKGASSDPKNSPPDVETVASDQVINTVNVPALQPASAISGVVGSTSKPRKSKAQLDGACATVPGTSESAVVESEVTAAIFSIVNELPPEPPVKPQPVKRKVTKRTTTSSRASSKSAAVVNAAPLEMIVPPCPICKGVPFHIRYFCPVFLKGPEAIRARLEELRGTDEGKKEWLINDLESMLRESKATSVSSLDVAPTNNAQTAEILSPPPDATPVSRTPNIPTDSCLSEVIVESRNEGSSSESSDNTSNGEVEPKEPLTSRKRQTMDVSRPLADDDLEAVIHGPVRKRQSILNVLDRIVRTEEEEEEGSDSKEDEAELEEDPDEESGRPKHRLSKLVTHSSDMESEEDVSRSPSPDNSDNPRAAKEPSSEPLEEPINQHNGDVDMGMRDVEGQDVDGSEETHAESDHRIVVDALSGEIGALTNVPLSPLLGNSVSQPSDARSDEPREAGQTEGEPTSNGADGISGVAEDPTKMEADPIEPVDELEPPAVSRSSDVDPIEAPSEDNGALFSAVTQSTPKSGVTKRIKTRNGQTPDDGAEGPVLLELMSTEITEAVTKETPTSQEPATTRKSPRFSSLCSTSTPAAVAWLNHRAKGARSIKAAKTPARRGSKNDVTQGQGDLAKTPSLNRWETLGEPPSSPSVLPDEPSLLVDELMSSPAPENYPILGRRQANGKSGLSRTPMASSKPGENSTSHGKQRLFDLTPSQTPFPYSQYQGSPALPNGAESVGVTDSEEEEVRKVTKAKTKPIAGYRSLSQLASQATLFSPSLPTPATNKSMANGKAKRRAPEDSSSSSSSDTDEANGSEHIPRGRRAGSVLVTKKKRGMLSSV